MTYDQFKAHYTTAFRHVLRYRDRHVGSSTSAKAMARLAADYPDFLLQLELEAEKEAFVTALMAGPVGRHRTGADAEFYR